MAAVLEYLTAEVIECSGEVCHNLWYNHITPRHIQTAIRSDNELDSIVREAIAQRYRREDPDSDDDEDDEQEDKQEAEPNKPATRSSPGEDDLREIEQGTRRLPLREVAQNNAENYNVDVPD